MNTLIDFFNDEERAEEAMYFFEMHGFLTSLVIQPGSLSAEQVLDTILGGETANASTINAISELQKSIEQALLNGDFPDIITDDEDDQTLTLWTSGFMQGVFAQENDWFQSQPEEVAELTLPILSCSELLDDEMGDISEDDDMLDDMAEKIPDCIIDLYLLFNASDSA
jgi:uncharacterized protein